QPRPRHSGCAPILKAQGVLLQKIIASERRNMPCVAAELKLDDLPCCAVPPFTLLSVQQSGIQPWWTPLDNQTNHQKLQLCISIPVCCRVRDACGKQYQATSVVEVDVSIRPPCPVSECWRHSIYVVPCVRLCMSECRSDTSVFQAKLQVSIEIYLLRPEPCMIHRPEPSCPELPLYPQPIKPDRPCWPQCQADQDLCGWPRQG
ncbi:MAG: hypothetical protein RR142_03795, partial [Clostridia bacterium]